MRRFGRRRGLAGLVVLACGGALAAPRTLRAQEPPERPDSLGVVARWDTTRFHASRAALELQLSRPLREGEERLDVAIGSMDVSHLVQLSGTRAWLDPRLVALPAGDNVVTILVTAGDEAREVERLPLKVRLRVGLDRGAFAAPVELSGTRQLDRRDPLGAPSAGRGTLHDLTLRLGVQGEGARDGWTFAGNANAIGVEEESRRLRFAELQGRAPALDLSDYRVSIAAPAGGVTLGHQSTGRHRYLLNGFSSRGGGGALRFGRMVTLDAAVLNGTNPVGWANPFGLATPTHRIGSAELGVELIPDRPGGLRFDVSGMDGSVLPLTGVNQGAATDAERSRGGGVQLSASDPTQRVRLLASYARSRFTNPADPLLAGDSAVVAVREETRAARFGELSVELLRDVRLLSVVGASLSVVGRHEHVEPLYRSVGGYAPADRASNGVEASARLGVVSLTAQRSDARDNLARIASILTNRTAQSTYGVTVPVGALLRREAAWWLPQASVVRDATHQRGDGIPVDAGFSASHVPDQVSRNRSASLGWQWRTTTLGYRWNESWQDNRQPGREAADFRTAVHALSVGLAPGPRVSASLDASREAQRAEETGEAQRLARVGGSVRLQPFARTDVLGAASWATGRQGDAGPRSRNAEYQLELSRSFDLYRRIDGGTQGRLFVRYARTRAVQRLADVRDFLDPMIVWTLNAGGAFRLF